MRRSRIALLSFLAGCSLVSGCADGGGDAGAAGSDLAGCVASRDAGRYVASYASGFFRWDGVLHATMSVARLEDKEAELGARLARLDAQLASLTPGTRAYRDTLADRTAVAAKLDTAGYVLDYPSLFTNTAGKLSRALAEAHVPSARLCPEGGCAPGSDPDARFVHHAYRAFLGRDATADELEAARASLPDRASGTFDPRADHRAEIAAWLRLAFTDARVAECDAALRSAFAEIEASQPTDPGLPRLPVEPPAFFFRGQLGSLAAPLTRVALDRGPTAEEWLAIDASLDLSPSCASAADALYARAFGTTESVRPPEGSYRYGLAELPAPSTCP